MRQLMKILSPVKVIMKGTEQLLASNGSHLARNLVTSGESWRTRSPKTTSLN
jgi:hypothetical protein